MSFSKWHGLGNDYLLVERAELARPLTPERVQKLCDYHFGVGSDGIVEVTAADGNRAEVVIWNPDGSTAELSGNGTRIAARWLARRSGADEVRISVGPREVVAVMREGKQVEMDVGRVDVGGEEEIDVDGEKVRFVPVSVGNPHAVIRREPERDELLRLGPLVERHERFPERTNVQLVRVDGPHDVTVGVWERGAGETLSSGTSATAVAGAAVQLGWCESPVTVHLAGGDLEVVIGEDMRARLIGPAQEICHVELSEELLSSLADEGSAGQSPAPPPPAAAGSPVPSGPVQSTVPSGPDLPAARPGTRGERGVKFARRLDAVPPYLFAELERKIEEREGAGIDVISLGIGDPDLPTPEPVVEALARAARDPATHQYPSNRGTDAFRQAVADFYADRFGVVIDPDREVIPVLGGKEGVAHVALATLDPGDTALAPDPGYPPYTSGPVFAGATVRYLPLTEANDFLLDLESAPPGDLLFLNYPNNPTGAIADVEFFERAVRFGRERNLIVVHDNAYSEITFDGYSAPSFLQAPGAKEAGVEIFSLSKGWNMTGWRAGWIAGNAEIVEKYRHLKTNLDSGMFEAIQAAAIAALIEARDFPREMSVVYQRRRDLVTDALRTIGLEVTPPKATPYFWARVPDGYTSASFAELVLEQANVVVSPGGAYGPSGEGFVRLSLTVPDERLEEAVRRIEASLAIIKA